MQLRLYCLWNRVQTGKRALQLSEAQRKEAMCVCTSECRKEQQQTLPPLWSGPYHLLMLHSTPPLHCPSASHKSWLSSADVPLKFRNARVGFEARWVMGTPGRGKGREGAQKREGQGDRSGFRISMKGNMLTANKADGLVRVVNYLRCE